MNIVRNSNLNKILREKLPENFTVKINNGNGYCVFDFDGKGRGFSVESYENGNLVNKVETLTLNHNNSKKETVLVQSGEIGRHNVVEYKSLGDLIPLRVYEREYDDFGGGTHTYPHGFVLVDKNLQVVYKNKPQHIGDDSCIIRDATEFMKIFCKIGPHVMAYMDERHLAKENFKELLEKTFEIRKNTLKKLGKTEQIEQEEKVYKEMLEVMQKEFNQQKDSSLFYSMSIEK